MGHRVRSRLLRWFCLLDLCGLLVLIAEPVSSRIVRITSLGLAAALWLALLALLRRRPRLRVTALLLTLAVVGLPLLPSRNTSADDLREGYIQSLSRFEGVRYVWGGENGWGIDCSGLVRQGLIRANLRLGLRRLDGKLLREAAWLWWHDTTARGLRELYPSLGRSRVLFDAPSINAADHSVLRPGDFAVSADGTHTLVYVGDSCWLEACPIEHCVARTRIPSDHGWFPAPVTLMRWTQLDVE